MIWSPIPTRGDRANEEAIFGRSGWYRFACNGPSLHRLSEVSMPRSCGTGMTGAISCDGFSTTSLYRVGSVCQFSIFSLKPSPLPESQEFDQCGGAYVNCWLRAESEKKAANLASASIGKAGWLIESVEEECREVTESVLFGQRRRSGALRASVN